MLVLTRRTGEAVEISVSGEVVCRLVVTAVDPGRVRLGFAAPQTVAIHREELSPLARQLARENVRPETRIRKSS